MSRSSTLNQLFKVVSVAIMISMTFSMVLPTVQYVYAQEENSAAEESVPSDDSPQDGESVDSENTGDADSVETETDQAAGENSAEPESDTSSDAEGDADSGTADADAAEGDADADADAADAVAEDDADAGAEAEGDAADSDTDAEADAETDGDAEAGGEAVADAEAVEGDALGDAAADAAADPDAVGADAEAVGADAEAVGADAEAVGAEAEVTACEVPADADAAAGDVPAECEAEPAADEDAPLLSEIPEDVNLVVINEDGQVEPLATVAAAEILAEADPQFCWDGGCADQHFGPDAMAAAIEDARFHADEHGRSGTIFVEAGNFFGFELAGFDFGTSLTIEGTTAEQDDGDPGDDTPVTTFTSEVGVYDNLFGDLIFRNLLFSEGFEAMGNTADLTLENVIANVSLDDENGQRVPEPEDEDGPLPAAIVIADHQGDVTLDQVTADHDPNNDLLGGAIIHNPVESDEGGEPGDVTVIDSSFSTVNPPIVVLDEERDNEDHRGDDIPSLIVISSGDVSLDGVHADNNPGGGALIDTTQYAPIPAIDQEVYCRDPIGLIMCSDTDGDGILDTVDAPTYCTYFPGWCEASVIDETAACGILGEGYCTLRAGNVSVQNSTFDYNALGVLPNGHTGPPGLEILSLGDVDLTNVDALGNPAGSVRIDNRSLPGMEIDTLALCGELGYPFCTNPGELNSELICEEFAASFFCRGPEIVTWAFCEDEEFGRFCQSTMPWDVPPGDVTITDGDFDFIPSLMFDTGRFCRTQLGRLVCDPWGGIDPDDFCSRNPLRPYCGPDGINFELWCAAPLGQGPNPGCVESESYGSGVDIQSHGDVTLLDVNSSGHSKEGAFINNRGPEIYTYTYQRGRGLRVVEPDFEFALPDGQHPPVVFRNIPADSHISIYLPFDFEYFGNVYRTIFLNTSGFLSVNAIDPQNPPPPSWLAQPISQPDAWNGVIAGWWGPLNLSQGGAIRYWAMDGGDQDEGDQVFILEFRNVPHHNRPDRPRVTMQFKLFEATGDIEVHYQNAPPVIPPFQGARDFHSAGVENPDGTYGLYYYYGRAGLDQQTAVGYSTLYRALDVIGRLPGGDVFIQDSTFNHNGFGLDVISDGDITLENVTASLNEVGGASLNNKFYDYQVEYQIDQQAVCNHPFWPRPDLSCRDTNRDGIPDTINQGLYCRFDPLGICTEDDRIDVEFFCDGAPDGLCFGGETGTVSISSSHFDMNGLRQEDGPPALQVETFGEVTLSDVTALNNPWGGARIDNSPFFGDPDFHIDVLGFCSEEGGYPGYCHNYDWIDVGNFCMNNWDLCHTEDEPIIDLDAFCHSEEYNEFCFGGGGMFDLPPADVTISSSSFDFATTRFTPWRFCQDYNGHFPFCAGGLRQVENRLCHPASPYLPYCDPQSGFDSTAYCEDGLRRPGCYYRQSFGTGLDIMTEGDVELTDVSASGHGQAGARIGDWDVRAGNVFIDPSSFNDNGYNSKGEGGGLNVFARGDITLLAVTASGNASFGAILNNQWVDEPTLAINELAVCGAPGVPRAMCLDTNDDGINDALNDALICRVRPEFCDGGSSVVPELFCHDAPPYACYLQLDPADVSVTSSVFDDNGRQRSDGGHAGLEIFSYGDVSLQRVAARNNPWGGVYIDNFFDVFHGCNGDCNHECNGHCEDECNGDCNGHPPDQDDPSFGPPMDLDFWFEPGDVTINTGNFDFNSETRFSGKLLCHQTQGQFCNEGRVVFGRLCREFPGYCSWEFGFDRDGYCADQRDLPGCFDTRSYGTGVTILSEGDVELTDVHASGHGQYGVQIGEDSDRYILADNVFIDPSTFNNNGYFSKGWGGGMYVVATGDITLDQVTASGNANFGAYLDNMWHQRPMLVINEPAACALPDVPPRMCLDTDGDQVPDSLNESLICSRRPELCNPVNEVVPWHFCDETPFGICTYSSPPDVLVTNSAFNQNGFYTPKAGPGLEIYSNGDVTLNRVAAFDNTGGGVLIDNFFDIFRGECDHGGCAIRRPVENGPRPFGPPVFEPGDVYITSGFFDYRLEPTFDGQMFCDVNRRSPACTEGGRFLPHIFCRHHEYGQYCDPVLRQIDALGLCTHGEWLPGCNISFGTGLQIATEGDVDLINVHASGHGRAGAVIGDWERDIRANEVFIDPSSFNNNGYNSERGGGLEILARGDITLDQVTASGNARFGAMLNNAWLPFEFVGFCGNCFCNDQEDYCQGGEYQTFDHEGYCDRNPEYCDFATHQVDEQLVCQHHPGAGEYCEYGSPPGYEPGDVTVTDSFFDSNGWVDGDNPYGLNIRSYGDIELDGVSAQDNPWGNAWINNTWGDCHNGDCPDAFGNVFVTNSNFDFHPTFDGNLFCEQFNEPSRICGESGRRFNFQAFCRHEHFGQFCHAQGGVDLDRYCYSGEPGPGCSIGWGTGLDVMSHGDVTLVEVQANGNRERGAMVNNQGPEIVFYVNAPGGGGVYTLTDPEFDYHSIATNGGIAVPRGDDNLEGPYDLGFDFVYYGETYDEIYICTNGYLSVTGDTCSYGPDPITDPELPDGYIAGYWTDMCTQDEGWGCENPQGTIYFETFGPPGNREFIVQFQGVGFYNTGENATFQFKLFEGSNNIEVHYLALGTSGSNYTIGIENQNASDGVEVYHGDDPGQLPQLTALGYYPGNMNMEEWLRLRGGDVLIQGGSYNGNDVGLDVVSDGNITLEGVDASFNRSAGALLDNQRYDYEPTPGDPFPNGHLRRVNGVGPGNVTITDSFFDHNGGYYDGGPAGLSVHSYGNVYLENVSGQQNVWGGAFIHNADLGGLAIDHGEFCREFWNGPGDPICHDGDAINQNFFCHEFPGAWEVCFEDGTIDTWAFCDDGFSEFCYDAEPYDLPPADVTVLGSNFDFQPIFNRADFCRETEDPRLCGLRGLNQQLFCNHPEYGLHCDLRGIIDAQSLCSQNPEMPGCSVSWGVGLEILTHGDVDIQDTSASGHGQGGLWIGNWDVRANEVFIDPSSFDNNGYTSEWGGGMEVYARGDITLDQVSASGNADFGAILNNRVFDLGLRLDEEFICEETGLADFCDEGGFQVGLWCSQPGPVPGCVGPRTFDVEEFCDLMGGDLCYLAPDFGFVSVTNSNFNNNGWWRENDSPAALDIASYGWVELDNVWARNNPYGGAFIDNTWRECHNGDCPDMPGYVDVNNSNFDYVPFDGQMYCRLTQGQAPGCTPAGFSSLEFCRAPGNGQYCSRTYPMIDAVSLCVDREGFPGCTASHGSGLSILSNGYVNVTDVNSSGHGRFGLRVGNERNHVGNVFIDPSTFNNNGYNSDWAGGMEVWSRGNITLLQVTASGNAHFGAWLDNQFLTGPPEPPGHPQPRRLHLANGFGPGNVVVTDSFFDSNGWADFDNPAGLNIYSYGDVTLEGVSAQDNPWGGAYIDNTWGECHNGDCPDVFGNVDVSLSNFDFHPTFDGDLFCQSDREPDRICGPGGMQFNYRVFCAHGYYGQFCDGQGGVDLGSYCYSDLPGPGCSVGWGTGLDIHSHGDVTLVDVDANGNWDRGAQINNRGPEFFIAGSGDGGVYTLTDPEYDLVDISQTGNPLPTADDSVFGPYPVGFEFDFYGNGYEEIFVCTNLGITVFNEYCTLENSQIPNERNPNGFIAGFWDDMVLTEGYYETRTVLGEQVFMVQLHVRHFGGNEIFIYQIKLFEGSNNIEVHYQVPQGDGNDYTLGIENQDGTEGVEYYYGSDPFFLQPETAVGYYPETLEEWLRLRGGDVLIQRGNFNGNAVGLDVTSDGDITLEGVNANDNRTAGALLDNQSYDYQPTFELDPLAVCEARPGYCDDEDVLNLRRFCGAFPRFCSPDGVDHRAFCDVHPDYCQVAGPGDVTVTDSLFDNNGGFGEGGPAALTVHSYGEVYLENVSAQQNVWGGAYIDNTNLGHWQINQEYFCNVYDGPACFPDYTINEQFFCSGDFGPTDEFCFDNGTINPEWFCDFRSPFQNFCEITDPYELPQADVTVINSNFDFTIFDSQAFCQAMGPSRACPPVGRFNPRAFCANPRVAQYCDPRTGQIDEAGMCMEHRGMPGCDLSYGTGLEILSHGDVDLMNVEASGHGLFGLLIGREANSHVGVRADTVFIDPSNFNYNGYNSGPGIGGGMQVYARGDIILDQVNSSGNADFGAYLNNRWYPNEHPEILPEIIPVCLFEHDLLCVDFGQIASPVTSFHGFVPGDVTVTNSVFDGNGNTLDPSGPGLEIHSYGNVNLRRNAARNNGVGGVYVDNTGWPHENGILLFDTLGDLPNGNGGHPAYGNVNVTQGFFNDNYNLVSGQGYGIYITSSGNVDLLRADALRNTTYYGGYINTSGDHVTVRQSDFDYNNCGSSSGYGLYITHSGSGPVTLEDVSVSNNCGNGAYINTGGSGVDIDRGYFDNNTNYGLYVNHYGSGPVTLTDLSANHNYGEYGVYVNSGGSGVTLDRDTFDRNTFDGNGMFDVFDGSGYGLYIYNSGSGPVTLADLSASNNYGSGAYIQSYGSGVTVDRGTFNSNLGFTCQCVDCFGNGYGLYVRNYGSGPVRLTDVDANSNSYYGAFVSDHGTGVYVNGSNFDGNGYNYLDHLSGNNYGDGYGLAVHHYDGGPVEFSGVSASSNYYGGAYVYTRGSHVLINDGSVFDYNGYYDPVGQVGGGYGLDVSNQGSGPVTLADMSASHNQGPGASVYTYGHGGNIFIYRSNFDNNNHGNFDPQLQGGHHQQFDATVGLDVATDGQIILQDVSASGNRDNGAGLGCIYQGDDVRCPSLVQVNRGLFDNNGLPLPPLDPSDPNFHDDLFHASAQSDGLLILADGDVRVTETSASNNQGNGLAVGIVDWDQTDRVNIVNQVPGTIFIDYSNASFNDNGLNGILLATNHEAYLAYVNALRNTYYGIFAPAITDAFENGVDLTGPTLVDLLCVNRSGGVAGLHIDGPWIDHGCPGDGVGGDGGGDGDGDGDDVLTVTDLPFFPLPIPVTGIGGTLLDLLGIYKGVGPIDTEEKIDILMGLVSEDASPIGTDLLPLETLGWTLLSTELGSLIAMPEGTGDTARAWDIHLDNLTTEQKQALGAGITVLGGVEVDVQVGGASVLELPSGGMIVSIPIPEGVPEGTVFTIQVWDPLLGWLNIETVVSPDGYAVGASPFAGTFILTGK